MMDIAETYRHSQPTPRYQVLVDGADVTPVIRPRLQSLTITDNRGFEADTLDLVLDDSDGKLDLPRRGASVRVLLGWEGGSLYDKGTYTVDEIEHSGTPDLLTIRAKSADFRDELQRRREISWHRQTIGTIVRSIAARQSLTPVISEAMADIAIEHIDQQMESDAAFLTRLATIYDAVAAVKNGQLLFIKAGQATSASGKQLPTLAITRQAGDQHRFAIADRGAYTGVIAHWHDGNAAKRKSVTVTRKKKKPTAKKAEGKKQYDDVLIGSEDNVKILRHLYASEHNAKRAALAEWERLQRGVAVFSITLAYGRPDLFPECPVTVSGYKPAIDGAKWLATKVTHSLGDGGLTGAIELEVTSNHTQAAS